MPTSPSAPGRRLRSGCRLSLDGAQHERHRGPFNRAFRHEEVHARLASFTQAETGRLVSAIQPHGTAELRRAVAGPLAVTVMAETLGLGQTDPARILAWYDGIVAAVQAEAAAVGSADPRVEGATAGSAGPAAFAELAASLREVITAPGSATLLSEVAGPLTEAEAISNAAVLMFGGIETTEGMIANALLHLLSSPAELDTVLADRGLVPAAIEASLRLEPAAAVVDRYATSDARLGGADIRAGDQVTVSIAGAEWNKAPSMYEMEGALSGHATLSRPVARLTRRHAPRQGQVPVRSASFPALPTPRGCPRDGARFQR
jgi:cytochrome P450